MEVNCEICKMDKVQLKYTTEQKKCCKKCFFKLFEDKINETIIKNKLLNKGDNVIIGLSGGKDSVVLSYVMNKLNKKYEYGIKLYYVSIDEGIKGYRDHSLDLALNCANIIKEPLYVYSFKQLFGWSMDEIMNIPGNKKSCTYCGAFRRQALETAAKMIGANKIVTGHNADDAAETIMMNIIRGDMQRFNRCIDHRTFSKNKKFNVERIKPMQYIYERDIVLYSYYKDIKYFSVECTYAASAARGKAREFLKQLEEYKPMSIIKLINSAKKFRNLKFLDQEPKICKNCNLISGDLICKACSYSKLFNDIKKKTTNNYINLNFKNEEISIIENLTRFYPSKNEDKLNYERIEVAIFGTSWRHCFLAAILSKLGISVLIFDNLKRYGGIDSIGENGREEWRINRKGFSFLKSNIYKKPIIPLYIFSDGIISNFLIEENLDKILDFELIERNFIYNEEIYLTKNSIILNNQLNYREKENINNFLENLDPNLDISYSYKTLLNLTEKELIRDSFKKSIKKLESPLICLSYSSSELAEVLVRKAALYGANTMLNSEFRSLIYLKEQNSFLLKTKYKEWIADYFISEFDNGDGLKIYGKTGIINGDNMLKIDNLDGNEYLSCIIPDYNLNQDEKKFIITFSCKNDYENLDLIIKNTNLISKKNYKLTNYLEEPNKKDELIKKIEIEDISDWEWQISNIEKIKDNEKLYNIPMINPIDPFWGEKIAIELKDLAYKIIDKIKKKDN